MQIAIVDDRAEDREELSACLENYMKKHQLDYLEFPYFYLHSSAFTGSAINNFQKIPKI